MNKKSRQPFWNNVKIVPYLYILPNMLLFAVFMLLPIAFSGVLSLVKWNGRGKAAFIGLENYLYLFRSKEFLTALWNTVKFTLLTVPVLMLLAFCFAMLLNRGLRLRGFFRGVLYLPSIISTVVVGMVFTWIFNSQIGLVNYLLQLAGFGPVEWMNEPRFAMFMIVAGTIWSYTGYYMIIYLAGLQGIPGVYYEAAAIDGADRRQTVFYITLPLLRSSHIFILITAVINSFRSFDLIYVMTKGGPLNATKTLVVYIYEEAFKKNYFGRASAAGVVLFVILLLFTILQLRGEREGRK